MIQAEIKFEDNGARIVVLGRDKDGNRTKQMHKFQHYFYAPDPKGNYKTLFNESVRRIPIHKFWLAKQKIQEHERTFEADLSYVKRFLIDHGDEYHSEAPPRKVFWDIETKSLDPEDLQGALDPKTGEIISIVAYDSYTKEFTEFIQAPDLEIKTERKMLLKFANYINKVSPDIMSGWNCSRFDVPFLIDRMEANDVKLSYLSPIGRVDDYHVNVGREIKIRGVALIDLMKAYKKISRNELESYKLEFVAQKELGTGKNEISKLPQQLWEAGDYDKLLLYNRVDVELLAKLDEKLGIIEYLDAISTIASCDISETLYNSRIVDSYILKRASQRGVVLPTRDFGRKRTNYTGAFVFDTINGIHEKVAVYDFNSLYPSLIISHDISPETIKTRDSGATYTVERGNETGFIPSILEDILDLRKQYRNKGEDNNQRVMKEIANSFYGVTALPSFRLYTPEMAAMITAKGREIILRMIEVVETVSKYKIVAGDTDSIMVSGIESREEGEQLENKLNKAVEQYAEEQEILDNRLRIEFEAYAIRAVFAGKKRYAMKLEDGSYKIRGFQMVRSDAQQKTKEIQEEVIHRILDGATNVDIREYYLRQKDKILSGQIYGIGIPRHFKKKLEDYANNVAVKAAEFSNKYLDKNIGAGDKILYYHIKYAPVGINDPNGAKMIKEAPNAIALDYGDEIPDGYIVNSKKHWERIEKAIVPLLEEIGCLDNTVQQTLGDFL